MRTRTLTRIDFWRAPGPQGELSLDESLIISGAMGLVGKSVECRMRPLHDTFLLSQDAVLDEDTVDIISDSGYVAWPAGGIIVVQEEAHNTAAAWLPPLVVACARPAGAVARRRGEGPRC